MIRRFRKRRNAENPRGARRASFADVNQLDDHLLRDIGLNREDIPHLNKRLVIDHRF